MAALAITAVKEDVIGVVDVETTGLCPERNDRIIEIAVVLTSPDGVIRQEYDTLINPARDLGPTAIHRISAAEILHAPQFSEVAGDILEVLRQATILAGHNVRFDRRFLAKEYERVGVMFPDTALLCTCDLLGRQSLQACCKELEVNVDGGTAHRALADARATAALIHHLCADDPAMVGHYRSANILWPTLEPQRTPRVTRDCAQQKLQEPPRFLQRILSKVHHDVETEEPNVLSYLTLIDRVLEDRIIDSIEESALVEAWAEWKLSRSQVIQAHGKYIHSLAVNALSDGVISEAERSDLVRVARLLGHTDTELDVVLESAAAQLRTASSIDMDSRSSASLSGMRVCFTGELQSRLNGQPITRDVAEALAAKAGLEISNGVTKKLDLLVVADPHTQSGKAKKARTYGTRILADSVFWKLIGISVD